jgi:pre-mRNA-splicing factor SPF27
MNMSNYVIALLNSLLKIPLHSFVITSSFRVKSKAPMAPLDMTRYRLEAPVASKRHDFGAWKASVDNAHSQLEHQYLRITNLELMLKYGDKV